MAFNKNKVMDSARKYVEKGQVDRAIKEYLRVVQEDPKDVRVWLKIGDLYAKKGAKQDATETYLKVAKFYSEQGFYLKAVAVYKQILKLDARLVEVNLKLAELYRQLGLLSDAMQHFEMVAAHFHREGKTREALATVRQLVDLDPENVATRIKLAELYSKEQMLDEAIKEFTAACDYLRSHNRQDDFIKVAERLLWHKPEAHGLNRELATLYLRRNDPRRALQKLQVCFKADPRDVETLALLAQAFQALDQKGKTVSVLKELARVLDEDKKKDQAADVHRKILMYVPEDPDSRAYLGEPEAGAAAASAPPVPQAAPRTDSRREFAITNSDLPPPRVMGKKTGSMPLISDAVDPDSFGDPELIIDDDGDEEEDFAADFAVGDESARFDTGSVAGEMHAEEIIKILTETDVYVKYGLHQKAIEHLKRVFDLDPDNAEARERLKEIYVSQGREQDAIDELMRLAEMAAPSDAEQAEFYLREILAMDGTYEPAYELARRFHLELASGPQVEIIEDYSDAIEIDADSLGGAVEPVEEEIDFGDMSLDDADVVSSDIPSLDDEDESFEFEALAEQSDAEFEFELDDLEEELPASSGTGVTQEVSLDQVEDMVALEADDEELGFEAEFSLEEEEVPAATFEPVAPRFDPADARAFDAAIDHQEARSLNAEPIADIGGVESDFGAATSDDFGAASDEFRATDDFGAATADAAGTQLSPPQFLAEPEPYAEVDPPLTLDQTVDSDYPDALDTAGGDFSEPSGGASIEDDLDEADFFIAQSLYDEARDILTGLLDRYPNHPLITAKLQDVDAMALAAGGARVETPAPELHVSDLEEISEHDVATAADKPAVLLERPVADEDADTHYDLGLAYKEMGLYGEAITAFEKVIQHETRLVQCFLMIGMCHREQGNLSEAVHHFKQGLHVHEITEREKQTVYYEIGFTYEAMNDPSEALYYLEMVAKRDPGYRDAAARLASLRANTGGNGGGRHGRPEDTDAAIDSLIAESDYPGRAK